MTAVESQTVTRALGVLAEAFQRDVSAAVLAIYMRDLVLVPETVALAAIRRAHRECRFFPSLAELLDFCGKDDPRHAERVEMLRQAFKEREPYARVVPNAEETRALLARIGRPVKGTP